MAFEGLEVWYLTGSQDLYGDEILRRVDEQSGGIVAVLQDQYTRVQNLEVPFFGEPAPTPVGLARLALRYGIPVVPVAMAWDPESERHRVLSENPLEFKVTGQTDDDVVAVLSLCSLELENFIRRNPAEWVLFHNRWKA